VLTLVRHWLRVEDALLFGWLVFLQPLILDVDPNSGLTSLSGQDNPLVGLVYLAAAAGAVVCLATRSPGEGPFEFESVRSLRSYAAMPFMAALSLIAAVGAENAGLASAEAAFVPVAALAVACLVFYEKLPTLAPERRRVLMAPFVLLSAGMFDRTMADVFDSFDVGDLIGGGLDPSMLVLVFVLLVLFSLPFYAMLVFAPRQIAESEGTWLTWAARYALFLVGAVVGVSWLRALGL